MSYCFYVYNNYEKSCNWLQNVVDVMHNGLILYNNYHHHDASFKLKISITNIIFSIFKQWQTMTNNDKQFNEKDCKKNNPNHRIFKLNQNVL